MMECWAQGWCGISLLIISERSDRNQQGLDCCMHILHQGKSAMEGNLSPKRPQGTRYLLTDNEICRNQYAAHTFKTSISGVPT